MDEQMPKAHDAFNAFLDNGAPTDTQGNYIGDPLDLWLAAWEEATAAALSQPAAAKPVSFGELSCITFENDMLINGTLVKAGTVWNFKATP